MVDFITELTKIREMECRVSTNGMPIEVEFLTFSGGEEHVQLGSRPDWTEHPITIYAKPHNSIDMMRVILLHSALVAEYGLDQRIGVHLPYLPYARQDKVHAAGQAPALMDIMHMFTGIKTHDIHNEKIDFGVPFENIPQSTLFKDYKFDKEYSLVASPDKGARDRVFEFCRNHVQKPVHAMQLDKVRDPKTGEITGMEITGYAPPSDPPLVITLVDDICDGGRTFIEASKLIKAEIPDVEVHLLVTHFIGPKTEEKITLFTDNIDKVITTDSRNEANLWGYNIALGNVENVTDGFITVVTQEDV